MGKFVFVLSLILVFQIIVPNSSVVSQKGANSYNELDGIQVGIVHQTFTDAAYKGYYTFYHSQKNPETYLSRSVKSTSNYGAQVRYALTAIGLPESQIWDFNDQMVHKGEIFSSSGVPKVHILIFTHNEYVSLEEYHNVVRFIAAGGSIVIFNGNAFFAEVDYNPETNIAQLLNGHSWEFDSVNASLANFYKGRFGNTAWNNENFEIIGSRYTSFKRGEMYGANLHTNSSNPHPITQKLSEEGYSKVGLNYGSSHEENSVITPNMHIIADWNTSFSSRDRGYKIYEKLPFGPYGGSVIHFAFYNNWNIGGENALNEFFKFTILHLGKSLDIPWIRYPYDGAVFGSEPIVVDFTKNWQTEAYLDESPIQLDRLSALPTLSEGMHNLTILFEREGKQYLRAVNFAVDLTDPYILVNGSLPLSSYEVNQTLNITVVDANPAQIRLEEYNGYHSRTRAWMNWVREDGSITGYTHKVLSTNNSYIEVHAIDSAGRYSTTFLEINKNASSYIPPLIVQRLSRYNSTHLKANIPAFQQENTSAYLQVSYDRGTTWNRIKFQSNSTIPESFDNIALFKDNGMNPWVRVQYIGNHSGYAYTIQKFIGAINTYLLTNINGNTLHLTSFQKNFPEEITSTQLADDMGNTQNTDFTLSKITEREFELTLNQTVGNYTFLQLNTTKNNLSIALKPIRDVLSITDRYIPTTSTITSTPTITFTPTESSLDTSSFPTPTSSTTSNATSSFPTPTSSTPSSLPTSTSSFSDTDQSSTVSKTQITSIITSAAVLCILVLSLHRMKIRLRR